MTQTKETKEKIKQIKQKKSKIYIYLQDDAKPKQRKEKEGKDKNIKTEHWKNSQR